jgi:hypothetical protein
MESNRIIEISNELRFLSFSFINVTYLILYVSGAKSELKLNLSLTIAINTLMVDFTNIFSVLRRPVKLTVC